MQPQTQGIKISQPGFNVQTCKDYELIFNSSWPSLAIVFDKTMAVTTDGNGNAAIPHSLGFIPLAMGWQFTDNTYSVSDGRFFVNIDKTNIYFPTLTANTTYYVNLKCYNIDITVPQNYLYLQPASVNSIYDPTYGVKVVKPNESITSSDLRSFILHSRAASPQVLAVVTEQSASIDEFNQAVISYTNPQGYTPWAFGYAQVNDPNWGEIYEWAPPVSQSYPSLQYNVLAPNTLSMTLSSSGGFTSNGSIIVLRDPLFASNSVQAVY